MGRLNMKIKYLIKIFLSLIIIFLVLLFLRLHIDRARNDFFKKFDLIEKGMREDDVIRILGKPDYEGWMNGYYCMGYHVPYSINHDMVYEIHLDKKGGNVKRKLEASVLIF